MYNKSQKKFYIKDDEGRIWYLSKTANKAMNKLDEARKIVVQNRKSGNKNIK
jgi:hypothetical protein